MNTSLAFVRQWRDTGLGCGRRLLSAMYRFFFLSVSLIAGTHIRHVTTTHVPHGRGAEVRRHSQSFIASCGASNSLSDGCSVLKPTGRPLLSTVSSAHTHIHTLTFRVSLYLELTHLLPARVTSGVNLHSQDPRVTSANCTWVVKDNV